MEDKDLKEKTFYIRTANELESGLMSKIFGDEAIKKTYQIQLKSVEDKLTEVYFTDISEINDQNTKEFSYKLLGNIQKQF